MLIRRQARPKLVAEIGCNHQGRLDLAKECIAAAVSFGAVDYVKFQKRSVRELLTAAEFHAPHPHPEHSFGSSYGLHREFLEFNLAEHRELKSYCESVGVGYACSVWDISSAREIIQLKPDYIKIPSACNLHFPLLDFLCTHFHGGLHISLGMTTRKEVEAIIAFLDERQCLVRTVFYACTSSYPTPTNESHLLEIQWLSERLNEKTQALGFSGHHLGTSLDGVAVALGASWIERHFTLNKTWKGSDQALSLTGPELRDLRQNLETVSAALTFKPEHLSRSEIWQRKKLKENSLRSLTNEFVLLSTLRTQIKKDQVPEREALFATFVQSRPILRMGNYILSLFRSHFLDALVCLLYGILLGARRFQFSPRLAIYQHETEAIKIRELQSVLTKENFKLINWRPNVSSLLFSLMHFTQSWLYHPSHLKNIFYLFIRLRRRYPLYICLRAGETLFTYQFLFQRFQAQKPDALLLLTEGNPHGSAALGVARRLKIATIYSSHAAESLYVSQLRCSLALFYGAHSQQRYLAAGSNIARSLFYGFKDEFRSVQSTFNNQVICICLPKTFSILTLQILIKNLRLYFSTNEIRLRPHPNSMLKVQTDLASLQDVTITSQQTLQQDLVGGMLALSGNSTVHLDALLYGVPSLYLPELNCENDQLLPFLKEKLVLEASVLSNFKTMLEQSRHYYTSQEWLKGFSSYINLQDSVQDFELGFKRELTNLIDKKETLSEG